MRLLALLGLVLTVSPAAGAGPRAVARAGGVWLDGACVWRGVARSPLVWSAAGDAVAFTGRARGGGDALVVLVPGAAPMTWAIPAAAQPARAVMWLGPTSLGAGPSALQPRLVASFSVER
jgi:hypothetical protein